MQSVPTSSEPDYSTIPDSAWTLFEVDGNIRRYRCQINDTQTVIKTETVDDDVLIRANQDELFDSHTRRFGEGRVVGRIPMNVLLDPATQIIEKLQEGDKDHLKWWLNRGENRIWRNFRGDL